MHLIFSYLNNVNSSYLNNVNSSYLKSINSIYLNNVNSSYLNNIDSSYLNNVSKSNHPYYDRYMYDTKYSWDKHVNSYINNYSLSGSNNYSDSYIYCYICGQSRTRSERGSSSKRTSMKGG